MKIITDDKYFLRRSVDLLCGCCYPQSTRPGEEAKLLKINFNLINNFETIPTNVLLGKAMPTFIHLVPQLECAFESRTSYSMIKPYFGVILHPQCQS